MHLALSIAGFAVGAAIVIVVLDAALRTFVLPRGVPVMLTRAIGRGNRVVFDVIARPGWSYERRDRLLALYAPVTLITFPVVWIAAVLGGFTLMFRATTAGTWIDAFRISGSSLLTLGFALPDDGEALVLVFIEATIGLGLLALLISYLPTIYGAFSRRELAVTQLSVRAGTPPSPVDMLTRAHLAGFMDRLDEVWLQWESWFVEIEETHTSLAILPFFRSPNPNRNWVVAAGAVLDAAAIRMSVLNVPFTPYGGLCLRSGYLSLRAIADFYGIEYDPDPPPDGSISISRDEFMDVYERLAGAGVPVRADREQAWRDFAGWRINYDTVLLTLAGMVVAPEVPWISDRSPERRHRPPLRARKPRV